MWLAIAAAVFAVGACATWFLSSRPILFTRLFVSYEERMVVRREILEDRSFGRRLKWIGFVQFLIGLGCVAGAVLLKK